MLTAATSNETSASSYADRVTHALSEFLITRSYADFEALAPLIGDGGVGVGPQSPADELNAEAACITLLKQHDSTSSAADYAQECVLRGLLYNDRWKKLFIVDTDAYEFVVMLTRYVRKAGILNVLEPDRQEAHRAFKLQVYTAMRPWLPESCTTPGNFLLRELASAFYGEAWCALAFDDCKGTTLSQLIATTKPMFLPGRIASDQGQDAHPLPELTC
jgi:hypothetical protein